MPSSIPGRSGLPVHSGEQRVRIVIADPCIPIIGPLIPTPGFPVSVVIWVELVCVVVIIVFCHEMYLSFDVFGLEHFKRIEFPRSGRSVKIGNTNNVCYSPPDIPKGADFFRPSPANYGRFGGSYKGSH
jgi:hypothetical protein